MDVFIKYLESIGFPHDKAAEWLGAIGSSAQAIVAFLVLFIGLWQLVAIKRQLSASVKQTELLAHQTQSSAEQTKILAEQTRLIYEQQRSEEERERRWITLQACERYDTDPILHECIIAIHDWMRSAQSSSAKPDSTAHKKALAELGALKPQAATVLNYIDGLAIGIKQGVYLEAMVKDHMEDIIIHHVDKLLMGPYVERLSINKAHYESATWLRDSWKSSGKRTAYQMPVNPSAPKKS